MTDKEKVRLLQKVIRAIMEYEKRGGPNFKDWDKHFDNLYAALRKTKEK